MCAGFRKRRVPHCWLDGMGGAGIYYPCQSPSESLLLHENRYVVRENWPQARLRTVSTIFLKSMKNGLPFRKKKGGVVLTFLVPSDVLLVPVPFSHKQWVQVNQVSARAQTVIGAQ